MAEMNSLGDIGREIGGREGRGTNHENGRGRNSRSNGGSGGRDSGNSGGSNRSGGSGGYSNLTAAQARDLHRRALEADQLAADLRAQRDMLIMQLREEDQKRWSYTALAKMLGCSRELVAQIVQRNRAGGKRTP